MAQQAQPQGNQQGSQQWTGPKYTLFLDFTDPAKKDGEWEVVVTATVLYQKRHAPRPSKEVVFQVNGEEVERLSTDDESGQVVTTIVFPQAGSYLLGAFLADEPGVRYAKRISIKAEEKKTPKPAKLIVNRMGRSGKYSISIMVFSEDGKPVPKAKIRIMDARAPEPQKDVEMEEDGSYKWELEFDDPERIIRLILLGTSCSEEIRLLGPVQHPGW